MANSTLKSLSKSYLIVFLPDTGASGSVQVVLEPIVRVHLWDLNFLILTKIKTKWIISISSTAKTS